MIQLFLQKKYFRKSNLFYLFLLQIKFITLIEVTASKKENLLLDIITITSSNNIGILNANTISTQTNNIYELTIEVNDSDKLKKYMNDLKQNSEIIKVERVFK